MIYTITTVAKTGQSFWMGEGKRNAAVNIARDAAKANPDMNTFVTWGRSTDGQHGYLNQDGNHAITGKAWLCA